jgi:hypothetical protein
MQEQLIWKQETVIATHIVVIKERKNRGEKFNGK